MSQDKETNRPHNALFLRTFGVVENAVSHFRETLPPALVAELDWPTTRIRPGTYVDQKLRDFQSDYLYEVRTLGGKPVLLYILFEHQRSCDAAMAFRIHQYMVRIWSDWRDNPQHTLPLPPIYPLVLYHGPTKWWPKKDLHQLIDVPKELRGVLGRLQPRQRYEVQDYSGQSKAELKGRALVRLTLFLFRHIDDPDFWQRLPGWLETMRQILDEETDGLEAIEIVLRYIFLVREDPPPEGTVQQIGDKISPEVQETFMSYAQKLEQTGWERATEAALQRSRTRLLRQLELKFRSVPVDVMRRILSASEVDIDRWSEWLLDASTVEEVFSGKPR